jgi:NADPH:quinone reductase-like Zn-dependent oxidoreductase
MGCYVEYKTMSENGSLAIKPTTLTFEEAAALSFGGTTALHFLRAGPTPGAVGSSALSMDGGRCC